MRIGRFSGALPLVLMTVLILAVGAFATVRQDAFLTSFNLNNLLLLTMPLALVTLGQTCALLVGGFDVSVAALMTFCVVVASFTMPFDKSGWALVPGGLVLDRRGARDWDLQRRAHPRPQAPVDHRDARDAQHPRRRSAPPPGSPRRPDLERRRRRSHQERRLRSDRLHRRRRPRRRSATCGCTARARASRTRAVGLDETSSRRLGMATGRIVFLAFVVCSVMASLAGLYLAAQVQIGSPILDIGSRWRASPAPSSAERASRAEEDRSSARCSPRSSSR